MPAVQRLITVSPSCQPSVIEVCYGDGEVRSIAHSQEVVGVCGDTIGRISESRLPLQCEDKFTVHTHTLNLLMALFPGLPGCDGTRKVKTSRDFAEARDSEWQWHQLGHMQVCTSLQTDNHASTPPLSFLQAGCPSCRRTNSIKALKA